MSSLGLGFRPPRCSSSSSLGQPDHMGDLHLPYLVWRDLDIERTPTKGVFYVKITIRNLKTNSVNPEKAYGKYFNKELVL